MAQVITTVEKTFPPRAVPHEVALDAKSVLDQYVMQSENFDRSFQILKDFQKFLHELQEKTRRRRKIKEEYEHYSGKVRCGGDIATSLRTESPYLLLSPVCAAGALASRVSRF